jgi:glycopeptide antibiotics resistance protein
MGIAYLLFLIWAVLWKCGVPYIGDAEYRGLNLYPFRGNTNWELQFNLLIFIPLGFCVSSVFPKQAPWQKSVITLAISLSLEIAQYAIAVGKSDITDLLTNTLGGVIGIAAYCLLARLFGKNGRKAALIVCILLMSLVLYMTVSFIAFGLLNIGYMIIKL